MNGMLPRAASRRLLVGDVAYRWLVSETTGLLMIERADGIGGRLEVELTREIAGMYWVPLETLRDCGPVTPKIVATLVSAARQRGWSPERESGVFRFARSTTP